MRRAEVKRKKVCYERNFPGVSKDKTIEDRFQRMNSQNFPKPRPHLQKITKYSAGKTAKDIARNRKPLLKLSSNEATWGPSPDAIDALRRGAALANLYPPSQSQELRELIGGLHGLSADHIVLGNGSNEVIQFLIQAYAGPRDHVLVPEITFSMYRIYSEIANVKVRTVPVREDFSIDLDLIRKKVSKRTKIIFLASPNNPTGLLLSKMELELLLMGLNKEIIVAIDEAYVDFSNPALRPDFSKMILSGKYPNLIILRTFSKAFGLAGLRLGYGISNPVMSEYLKRMGQHFNLNSMALTAGLASVKNLSHYKRIVSQTKLGRNFIEKELSKAGIPFIPSEANFIMIQVGDGKQVFEKLGEKGFIVRELASFGLPEYIRVTVSNMEHNEAFMKALKEILLRKTK